MATRHSSPAEQSPRYLNRAERLFWRQAFLAAEVSTLVRSNAKIAPEGVAHLAAQYADAAIAEERRRIPL